MEIRRDDENRAACRRAPDARRARARQLRRRAGSRRRAYAPDRAGGLILTSFDLDEYAYAALRAGAAGCLLKDVLRDRLIVGVRTVAASEALLAPAVRRRMIERFVRVPASGSDRPAALAAISHRQLAVLRLLARGLSNADIGTRTRRPRTHDRPPA